MNQEDTFETDPSRSRFHRAFIYLDLWQILRLAGLILDVLYVGVTFYALYTVKKIVVSKPGLYSVSYENLIQLHPWFYIPLMISLVISSAILLGSGRISLNKAITEYTEKKKKICR